MDFESLIQEYRRYIWQIINSFVKTNNIPFSHADDIYQEVCIRLFKKLGTYDVGKSSMKTFVATNTEIACMRYRREYYRTSTIQVEDIENIATAPDFEQTSRIIDEYPTTPFNRKVIYQKLYGYTQQEIAKEFHISQSKVSRILSDFRDYLVEQLKN